MRVRVAWPSPAPLPRAVRRALRRTRGGAGKIVPAYGDVAEIEGLLVRHALDVLREHDAPRTRPKYRKPLRMAAPRRELRSRLIHERIQHANFQDMIRDEADG